MQSRRRHAPYTWAVHATAQGTCQCALDVSMHTHAKTDQHHKARCSAHGHGQLCPQLHRPVDHLSAKIHTTPSTVNSILPAVAVGHTAGKSCVTAVVLSILSNRKKPHSLTNTHKWSYKPQPGCTIQVTVMLSVSTATGMALLQSRTLSAARRVLTGVHPHSPCCRPCQGRSCCLRSRRGHRSPHSHRSHCTDGITAHRAGSTQQESTLRNLAVDV